MNYIIVLEEDIYYVGCRIKVGAGNDGRETGVRHAEVVVPYDRDDGRECGAIMTSHTTNDGRSDIKIVGATLRGCPKTPD